jgi:hypothetical protein
MRNMTRFGLAVFAVICGLQVLPASAATSADLRPAGGKQMVYESYVSNDPKECKQISGETVQLSGAASIFVGADTWPSVYRDHMHLQCEQGYVMVNMNQHTEGRIGTTVAGGGAITNYANAMCCPVKHRWAPPQIPA